MGGICEESRRAQSTLSARVALLESQTDRLSLAKTSFAAQNAVAFVNVKHDTRTKPKDASMAGSLIALCLRNLAVNWLATRSSLSQSCGPPGSRTGQDQARYRQASGSPTWSHRCPNPYSCSCQAPRFLDRVKPTTLVVVHVPNS